MRHEQMSGWILLDPCDALAFLSECQQLFTGPKKFASASYTGDDFEYIGKFEWHGLNCIYSTINVCQVFRLYTHSFIQHFGEINWTERDSSLKRHVCSNVQHKTKQNKILLVRLPDFNNTLYCFLCRQIWKICLVQTLRHTWIWYESCLNDSCFLTFWPFLYL